MDNHQQELADQLCRYPGVVVCRQPSDLTEALQQTQLERKAGRSLPTPIPSEAAKFRAIAFANVLDADLGYQTTSR